MSLTPRTISNVELRIQWSGEPGPFFSAEHDGFPGADVPVELVALLRSMIGSTVTLDDANFKVSGGAALRTLCDSFVGVRGPGANHRWSLSSAYNETRTSDGNTASYAFAAAEGSGFSSIDLRSAESISSIVHDACDGAKRGCNTAASNSSASEPAHKRRSWRAAQARRRCRRPGGAGATAALAAGLALVAAKGRRERL